jgi:hypothetical protein
LFLKADIQKLKDEIKEHIGKTKVAVSKSGKVKFIVIGGIVVVIIGGVVVGYFYFKDKIGNIIPNLSRFIGNIPSFFGNIPNLLGRSFSNLGKFSNLGLMGHISNSLNISDSPVAAIPNLFKKIPSKSYSIAPVKSLGNISNKYGLTLRGKKAIVVPIQKSVFRISKSTRSTKSNPVVKAAKKASKKIKLW